MADMNLLKMRYVVNGLKDFIAEDDQAIKSAMDKLEQEFDDAVCVTENGHEILIAESITAIQGTSGQCSIYDNLSIEPLVKNKMVVPILYDAGENLERAQLWALRHKDKPVAKVMHNGKIVLVVHYDILPEQVKDDFGKWTYVANLTE